MVFFVANGLFTLHGIQVQGTGLGAMGPTDMLTLVGDRERNQDPLFPIVLVRSLHLSQSRSLC